MEIQIIIPLLNVTDISTGGPNVRRCVFISGSRNGAEGSESFHEFRARLRRRARLTLMSPSFQPRNVAHLDSRRDAHTARTNRMMSEDDDFRWRTNARFHADAIAFVFDGIEASPVGMFEFGDAVSKGRCVVMCSNEFECRAFVEATCARHRIAFYGSTEEVIAHLEAADFNLSPVWIRG